MGSLGLRKRVSAVIRFARTNPAKYMRPKLDDFVLELPTHKILITIPWFRRDQYEKKTLYWAEKTIKGSLRHLDGIDVPPLIGVNSDYNSSAELRIKLYCQPLAKEEEFSDHEPQGLLERTGRRWFPGACCKRPPHHQT